ncbi:MAG: histidinol dehydrogenase [Methanolobus sp.]|nr:histidinol dehydrogenase [Methanolobus sp.]
MLYKKLSELTDEEKSKLIGRGGGDLANVGETVAAILKDVRHNGDAALRQYTRKFDGADIEAIEVTREEIDEAVASIDPELMKHLEFAASNIRKFHEAQMPQKIWFIELSPGIELGQKFTALESVGAYVPGGRASYPSTALMTIVPAKVAGVKNVVMCTPPGKDGKVNPLTLAAAKVAGADHVYRLGGVQAVAGMAYGTESVMKVDKIVGPGNVFVTAAKMQVRDVAEIDFPAGPSELLIIADDSCNARMAASDMIAQAEHDPSAVSVMVTTSQSIASQVRDEVIKQAKETLRQDIVNTSLENAAVLVASSMAECVSFSNSFAPEHLEIMVHDPDPILEGIEHAGSIFVGNYAPVPVGDYASGTNHVLPTAGYARIYSGLNLAHFMKSSSIQKISKKGLETLKGSVISIAEEEGLKAHADSVRLRFE